MRAEGLRTPAQPWSVPNSRSLSPRSARSNRGRARTDGSHPRRDRDICERLANAAGEQWTEDTSAVDPPARRTPQRETSDDVAFSIDLYACVLEARACRRTGCWTEVARVAQHNSLGGEFRRAVVHDFFEAIRLREGAVLEGGDLAISFDFRAHTV